MRTKYSVAFACLLMVFLLIAVIPTNAYAAEVASGNCGDTVTWSLDDAGVLTVSGTGAMTDYAFDSSIQGTNAPWYSHKEAITTVVIGEGITYVGSYAFMNLERVTSVNLPSTLVKIGGHSFQHLRQLTSVILPDGLNMIGEYAFYGSTFAELHLPSNLKTLSFFAISAQKVYIDTLQHWLNLELLPDTVNWISESAASPLAHNSGALYIGGKLATDIVIPDGAAEIRPYCFYQLTTMKSITLPGSVTTIGEGAFWGCDGLTEVEIPDSVTNLGDCVFMECENLTTAKVPSGLTNIPRRTFSGCVKLANFTLPETVTDIYESAFEGCENLTHINETNSLENVRYIGSYAFVNCKNLQFGELKLSKELYSLSAGSVGYSFAWCDGITGVTIPGSLYTVGGVAFENCANLEWVKFEDGVHVIGGGAFSNCSKLSSVLLPKTVDTIQGAAFNACPNLTAIYILNKECSIAAPNTFTDAGITKTIYAIGQPGVTTVYGHKGSTAEAYASEYGFTFEELPKTCEYDYHTLTTTVTKEATCMTDGIQTIACSLCDYEREEVIYYPGHKIANGVCEGCKESFVAYSDQKKGGFWALNTEGTLYLYNDEFGGDISDAPWEPYA